MSAKNKPYGISLFGCSHSNVNLQPTNLFRFSLLLSLVLLCLVAPISTFAQTSSTVRGVVKDPQGAVVPNATVTLTNIQRGDQRQTKTGDEGIFVFTSVDPTVYTLKVEAENFKTYELKEFRLSPGDTRSTDVSLEVGPKEVTVTVVQEVSPIKTDTGERSETLTSKQIENLSIIGRSSLELLRILPGVVNNVGNSEFHSFGGGSNENQAYTVNGIRGTNNQVSIDGSRLMDIGSNNGTIITANNDMVSEVTVKTSNFAAEYGTSGVQIIATTKGGGSDYHGQLYYYVRPNGLAAADRQTTIIGQTRTPGAGFQYPGGQIGGPIPLPFTDFNKGRDRLFFFVGYEVQRQKANIYGTRFGIVPTAAERNGDFSASLNERGTAGRVGGQPVICVPNTHNDNINNIQNPCTAVPNGNLRPFADPVGVALLNLYPLPNFTPSDPLSRRNYVSTVISPQNRTDLKMRFDLKVSEKTNAYLRLAREAETTENPYGLWWGASTIDLPTSVVGNNLGRSAALNVTTVLNSTMTNEFVFSVSKLKLPNEYADPAKISREALGIQNFTTPFQNPAFNLGSFRSSTPIAPIQVISWGDNNERSLRAAPGGLPIFSQNDSYSVSDTVSKVYKDHTLKFGGFVEVANKVQNNSAFSGNDGQIVVGSFGGGQARGTGGNAFSNLYAGRIDNFSQGTDVPTGHYRFWDVQFFAQDSWKIRSNFTLEYGVRVGFFPNNKELTKLGVVFDPSTYVRGGGLFIGGDPTKPNGYLVEKRGEIPAGIFSDYPTKIMPRLNFAWDIFGDTSTVIRGGAGIFHNRIQGNFQQGDNISPPNVLGTNISAWNVQDNDLTLSDIRDGRCANPPCNVGSFNPLTSIAASAAVSSQNRNSNDIPQVISTSLSVARRLPFDNVVEVGYVGTFGRHLGQTRNVNFIPNGTLSGRLGTGNNVADLSDPVQRYLVVQQGNNNGNAFRQLLPFPDYSDGVTFNEYTGTSNYHSLQVTLNRQLGRNLQYFFTYTYSKALGTTSTEGGSASLSSVDIRGRNYGILPFDRTHIFNASYNYTIPNIARGGLENWFTRGLFNGWQMSGITTFESGRPLRLRLGGDISNGAVAFSYFGTNENLTSAGLTGAIAPILLRNPQSGNTDVNSRYLDISAIQIPGFGQTGAYQSPFYIRSPGRNNWDITLFKNFKINESKSIQFRVAAFNVFNQAFSNTDNGDIDTTLTTAFVTDPSSVRFNPDDVINPNIPRSQWRVESNCFRIPTTTPTGGGTFNGQPCDPTRGFRFTGVNPAIQQFLVSQGDSPNDRRAQDTTNTQGRFGTVTSKRGHRRVELAIKFYF